MIDLHSHTTASDGQHSPDELVQLATAAGVAHLAVTDHDTAAGPARARAAPPSSARGLEIVHGIELSPFVFRREFHVLGHFLDPAYPHPQSFSARLRVER